MEAEVMQLDAVKEQKKAENRAHAKEYRSRPGFKDKFNAYMRQWYKERKEVDPEWVNRRRESKKAAARAYYYKHRDSNREYKLFINAKIRAKAKGLDFDLTLEDIILPEYCPVLGIKIDRKIRDHSSDYSPSVDRLDNTRGYTKDNIQIISNLANTMKNKATPEQLINFANWVHATFGYGNG